MKRGRSPPFLLVLFPRYSYKKMFKGQKNLDKGITFTYKLVGKTLKLGYWSLLLLTCFPKLKCPFNCQSGNEVVITQQRSQGKKRNVNVRPRSHVSGYF